MNNGTRILVVDDEESLREIVSQLLLEDGFDVATAASGEAALALSRARPFHLVLTDIRMGGMDGITLLQELKRVNQDTQVIIMTSYASLDTVIKAMRLGAYDYLIKPVDNLDLITAAVKRALEKLKLTLENRQLLKKLQMQNAELAQANEKLQELAIRDGLTGLFNHRYFREILNHEIARASRSGHAFSLLFFDVDFFKRYNDTFGHMEGDRLLASLGRILRERLRNTDTAARYGGEEFVILLPDTDKTTAAEVAEGIRRLIETSRFVNNENEITSAVTVSIGVATYPTDGQEATTLIKNADLHLYNAKDDGRNRVCCSTMGHNALAQQTSV
ncbi:MAG: response regulator receiver modulated diguanylate cyclase [Halothiobacillaceae bacterium]|nr:MAG: response regulator receiver modulated diguanylate cyclase [Halothiobacillaceae bacterium]